MEMPGDALEEVEEAVNLDRTTFPRKCTDDNTTGGIMARLYRRATLGNIEPCKGVARECEMVSCRTIFCHRGSVEPSVLCHQAFDGTRKRVSSEHRARDLSVEHANSDERIE